MYICLQRTYISVIHITYEEIQPSGYLNQPGKRGKQFSKKCPRQLVLQNEANFRHIEAYLPMKISCKFGEASWCNFPLRVLMSKISVRVVYQIAYTSPGESVLVYNDNNEAIDSGLIIIKRN